MWWPLLLLLLLLLLLHDMSPLLLLLSLLLAISWISIVPHHFRSLDSLAVTVYLTSICSFIQFMTTCFFFFSLTANYRITLFRSPSIADSFYFQQFLFLFYSTHFFRFRLVHAHFSFWYDNALSGNYSTFIDCAFSFVHMPIKRRKESDRELYGQVSVYSNINNISINGNSHYVFLYFSQTVK